MSTVSIVVPCFNHLAFLKDCLLSVCAQDFADWEMLVVDDCSTEGDPAAVIAPLADARIRLLRHTVNRGLAAARNTGLEAARAPLVLPLDGDDLLAPTFLSRLIAILEKQPELDCAFTDFELFGAHTGIRQMRVEPLEVLTEQQWLPGAGVLMKRDLWLRGGKYCEANVLRLGNEDWDFWLSAAEAGFRAAHLPEPLYRYRQHGQNMSSNILIQSDYVTRRFMLERHGRFFAKHGNARRFLAEGYWRAAETARSQRRGLRSLYLGLRAVALDRNWRRGWVLARNNASLFLSAEKRTQIKAALGRAAKFARKEA